jgi:hypothetical protein
MIGVLQDGSDAIANAFVIQLSTLKRVIWTARAASARLSPEW